MIRNKLFCLTVTCFALCSSCSKQEENVFNEDEQPDILPLMHVNGDFLQEKDDSNAYNVCFDSVECGGSLVTLKGKIEFNSNCFTIDEVKKEMKDTMCYFVRQNDSLDCPDGIDNLLKSWDLSEYALDKIVDYEAVLDLSLLNPKDGDDFTVTFRGVVLCDLIFTYSETL